MEAVRPATTDDRPRLRELAGELVADLLGRRGGALLVDADPSAGDGTPTADRLSRAVGSPDCLVAVGTLDDVVTGFACARVVEQPGGVRRGVLEACYVEPAARGVGLGRLLLEEALVWLDARHTDGVDGTALPGDREAKNFFESAGFKARLLTMHRPSR